MLVHLPRRKESLLVWVYDFSPERMEALKGDLLALFEGADASLVGDASDAGSAQAPETESEDAPDAEAVGAQA